MNEEHEKRVSKQELAKKLKKAEREARKKAIKESHHLKVFRLDRQYLFLMKLANENLVKAIGRVTVSTFIHRSPFFLRYS